MSQSNEDLAGISLGTCTLEKQIGQGGMGAVYLARQEPPSRYVAVKVLLFQPDISADYKAFLARFRREADLIAKLEHVNIMPIYEYGESEGITYLVMPYSPGGSLSDALEERGAFSLRETMSYIEQAASALDYAHAHGVVHRDIKPSNFLLHTDGRLLLADFGIARMAQNGSGPIGTTLTGPDVVVGSPAYMAPEMVRGEPVDVRADIYELGVMLFQMLNGHLPFKEETALAMVVKQLEKTLPSLHQKNPAIPAAVDRVVQKATAKRREDRYRSAGELARALQHAITSSDDILDTSSVETAKTRALAVSTVPLPQETVVSTFAPDTPFPVEAGQAMNFGPISTSDRSRDAFSPGRPVTPANISSPVTPYPSPQLAERPRSSFRSWSVFVAVLIIAIVLGGAFVGLHHIGAFVTTAPTATPTPAPTATATPTLTATPTPTATATPAQQAQALVQTYYDEINNADYQNAYNLWSVSYQHTHSYSSFASGFAHTGHDSISFGTITPHSDGTIQVSIALQSVEETSSGGITTSTFQGYYSVEQENGSWKLQTANIQKVG